MAPDPCKKGDEKLQRIRSWILIGSSPATEDYSRMQSFQSASQRMFLEIQQQVKLVANYEQRRVWGPLLLWTWVLGKDAEFSSPARTPKLQLAAEQPSTGECWTPPKKDTPHPRAKEKPQQDSRRGEIALRIKPHTHQRCLKGSNKTFWSLGPRDPTRDWARPALECLVLPADTWDSSGLLQGKGLWPQQIWVVQHVWRRLPLAPP